MPAWFRNKPLDPDEMSVTPLIAIPLMMVLVELAAMLVDPSMIGNPVLPPPEYWGMLSVSPINVAAPDDPVVVKVSWPCFSNTAVSRISKLSTSGTFHAG